MILQHRFILSAWVLLIALTAVAISSEARDEEIIKNLDFFQNLELIKDENPYTSAMKRNENAATLSHDTSESSSNVEKKQ